MVLLVFVGLFVSRIIKKLQADFDENIRSGWKWPEEQSIKFCWGSRSLPECRILMV